MATGRRRIARMEADGRSGSLVAGGAIVALSDGRPSRRQRVGILDRRRDSGDRKRPDATRARGRQARRARARRRAGGGGRTPAARAHSRRGDAEHRAHLRSGGRAHPSGASAGADYAEAAWRASPPRPLVGGRYREGADARAGSHAVRDRRRARRPPRRTLADGHCNQRGRTMSATKGHGKTAKHGGSRRADHAESDAGRSSTIPAAYWQYYGIGRGDAEAYREKMRAKLDALAGTVHLAMVIFQQACYAKLVGAKQSANEKAADVVVGTVISHVYGLLKSAVAAEVGPLGIAMKLGLEGIKQAASKGDGKVQEAELIARIVKGVEEAARDFVRKAKEQVAKIPDRQATDDGRLLQETENTTADLEALDSPGDGSIR